MRRRMLLATGMLGFAGCLSNTAGDAPATDTPYGTGEPASETPDSSDGRRYEECPREIIHYEELPDDVRDEIDAALDGRYEADRIYLREAYRRVVRLGRRCVL
ncbi:MAG: hypothetical protein ACQET5_07495 [Halobacteriota archaeon]